MNYMGGLHQVWRHITVSTVLTHEEIPEEGGQKKFSKIGQTKHVRMPLENLTDIHCPHLNTRILQCYSDAITI